MARSDAFLEEFLGRLAAVEGLRSRAMFGGWGLYAGKAFFGVVYRGRAYFRTTPATVARYTEQGMGPFRPNPKQTLWDYYEVPPAVYTEDEQLVQWAREAIEGRGV